MLIRPALPADDAEIAALLDAAFGAGRHARTASKLRVGATPIAGPSLVARCDGTDDITPCTPGALLGSIQLWPIALIADDDGAGRERDHRVHSPRPRRGVWRATAGRRSSLWKP